MPQPSPCAAPLVSVIMPAYNTAAWIAESIDSVLNQDYPAKELLVIDDGSTDGTLEILRAYGDRIRLITQRNQGSAVARNAGLDAAHGEFIAFLDSDDVWLPGKLSAQVRYLQAHPELGMIYSRWRAWKPDAQGRYPTAVELGVSDEAADTLPGTVPQGSGWLYNRLLFGSLLHTITTMARRELVERVGHFDPELKRGQDYDYWLRASRLTEIHKLDVVHALYRLHGDGCIKKWPGINYEQRVLEKALAQWGLQGPNGEQSDARAVRHRLAGTCFDFGYHHFWEGDATLADRALHEALRLHPTRATYWRYAALSLARRLGLPLPRRRATRSTVPS